MELVFVGGRKFKWGFHSEKECLILLIVRMLALVQQPTDVLRLVVVVYALLDTVPRQVTHLIANHVKEITTADLLVNKHVPCVMVIIR